MITFSAHVESISTRSDKSMKVVFSTLELLPSNVGDLFSLQHQTCYLALKPVSFNKDELEAIDNIEIDVTDMEKSPSKRMRAVMFLIWKQESGGYKDFNLFYANRMEMLIEQLKQKLA